MCHVQHCRHGNCSNGRPAWRPPKGPLCVVLRPSQEVGKYHRHGAMHHTDRSPERISLRDLGAVRDRALVLYGFLFRMRR